MVLYMLACFGISIHILDKVSSECAFTFRFNGLSGCANRDAHRIRSHLQWSVSQVMPLEELLRTCGLRIQL